MNGQTRLFRLQTENFRFVSFSSKNGQTTNLRLHDKQSVNRLWKTAWASVFHFPFKMAAYISIYIVLVCILQTENRNGKLPFVC
jgi:hypothetical protein